MSTEWVTGAALQVMIAAAPKVSEEFTSSAPRLGGPFRAGDEVLIARAGKELIGYLVESREGLSDSHATGLRVRLKPAYYDKVDDKFDYELWAYWRDVTGWRRP